MEAQYEEKFIVIHLKAIKSKDFEFDSARELEYALQRFCEQYKIVTGKELNQKYYVCNQDDPYAQKVIGTILEGESMKMEK